MPLKETSIIEFCLAFGYYFIKIGESGTLVKISENWSDLLGYPMEELYTRAFDLVHAEDINKTFSHLVQASNGQRIELTNRIKKSDDGVVWMHWTSLKSEEGFIYCIGQDVSKLISTAAVTPEHDFDRDRFLANLTETEEKIFQYLESKEGKPVSKNSILVEALEKQGAQNQTLNVHLFNLRKKLANTPYTLLSPGKGRCMLDVSDGGQKSKS